MRGSLPSWTASVPSADTRYYLLDSVDLARLKFYQVAEFSYCYSNVMYCKVVS